MSKPEPRRIQLSRRRGFNLQAESRRLNNLPAVKCDRTTPLGNPFVVGVDGDLNYCVHLHEVLLKGFVCLTSKATIESQRAHLAYVKLYREQLQGKNLACWCPKETSCHCDNLLNFVNKPKQKTTT